MELTCHDERGVMIIALTGDLDATNNEQLGHMFERLLAEGHIQVVLDLTEVEFIDSAGLVVMIRCLKRIRSRAGDVYLAALQPEVRCVLELTRLDRVFESFINVPAAVQHFIAS